MCLSTMISVKLNNRPYLYGASLTIFQACVEKKVFIPRFCYHSALKIAGNCRMCLVEEKSSLKPVASCAVSIAAGMIIYTETEMVKKAREGVIEYLLINHPLDCPICDQGGECDLQDQTMVFGADRGRFYELKRSTPNKNLGFLIKTFLNRCIHCARCTRFLHDLAGTENLNLLGRGYKTEISPYVKSFLTSEISGNIIDLCPVGALTSKPYAFKARPWELVSVYLFDIIEPFGASVELNYRGLDLLRILPRINYEVNDEWLSDKSRFYHDAINIQRLEYPFLLSNGIYSKRSWSQTLILWKNLLVLAASSGDQVFNLLNHTGNYLHGEDVDLQTAFICKDFNFVYGLGGFNAAPSDFRSNIYSRPSVWKFFFSKEDVLPGAIVLLYVNPRFESPVLNMKIRRLSVEKLVGVFLIGFCSNINYSYKHLGYSFRGSALRQLWALSDEIIFVAKSDIHVEHVEQFKSVYRIAPNYAHLSAREVGFRFGSFYLSSSNVRLSVGQPLGLDLLDTPDVFLPTFLHHVEDEYWHNYSLANIMKIPTKFYNEKFSAYVTESGYFFSTLVNIFGYSLPNVREETDVILALQEFLKAPSRGLLQKKSLQDMNLVEYTRFRDLPELYSNLFCTEHTVTGSSNSNINDYYASSLLARISPVLTLCSKAYTVIGDYKYVLNA